MYVGKTLFAQIMEFVPLTNFGRIGDRYGGNTGIRRKTCAEQFRLMTFAQLTWSESLRDIEVILGGGQREQTLCDGIASQHSSLDGPMPTKHAIGVFGLTLLHC
jgi:hypothetical protein